MENSFKNVDEYILSYPENVQILLKNIRKTILEISPDAIESISYGMPAYKLKTKPLVYFAAFKNHIGFYATPTGHEAFVNELSEYKQGKGSVQFPLAKPIPFDLIKKIVQYRVDSLNDKDK